ncbi:hypothetical protein [Anabaena azotica]|uniref:Uncharacterized protein n=1 Tax=Anabaena azotica FACHB-119 TaxID=947527 RepID=A0ABR8DBL0_9NOST|nr:hypothetical protein [Anabaena azotica]MBD2503587.1 hypothetical protein [Anabaena azotica FACHB-119]
MHSCAPLQIIDVLQIFFELVLAMRRSHRRLSISYLYPMLCRGRSLSQPPPVPTSQLD